MLTIKKAGQIDDSFMNNIRANVAAGNIVGAKALCQTVRIRQLPEWLKKACNGLENHLRDIDAAIENVGNLGNL